MEAGASDAAPTLPPPENQRSESKQPPIAQSSEAFHQVSHFHSQCRRQSHQRINRHVFLTALDVADEIRVQVGQLRQLLLGQPRLLAVKPDVFAQNTAMFAGGWHPSTQTRTGWRNHRIYTGFRFTAGPGAGMHFLRRRDRICMQDFPLATACPRTAQRAWNPHPANRPPVTWAAFGP